MTENLSPEAILKNLRTAFIGRNLLYYPTVTSTMDIAREAARRGAPQGTVVVADEQTAGRGRMRRVWLSPKGGNLALSVLLYPTIAELPRLFIIASLAVARSIEKVTGLKPAIKWPNDVLLNGKKVCGILIESELRGNAVGWAIVGIGINVSLSPASFPEIASIATSLSTELGSPVSGISLLQQVLEELEALYLALRRGEPVHQEWQQRLETLGRHIQVKIGDALESGYAESVADDGSLLLRRPDGSLARIVAGDVTLRL